MQARPASMDEDIGARRRRMRTTGRGGKGRRPRRKAGSLLQLALKYKERGGPAQLGIRDWAGLKGHIDDRNLAHWLRRAEASRPAPGGGG
jgi:hypothetical protein